MSTSRQELQHSRAVIHALVANAMKRDGFENLTDWIDRHELSRSTFYAMVRGRETSSGTWMKPSLDTLIAFARALRVPLHTLVYLLVPDAPGAPGPSRRPAEALALSLTGVLKLPLTFAGWTEEEPYKDDEQTGKITLVEEDFARPRDLKAFLIRGDSMAAGPEPIHHGDVVLIDTQLYPSNTNAVIARLEGGAYVCKVFKSDQHGTLLQSRNVDHTNGTPSAIPVRSMDQIVGPVVRVTHTVDTGHILPIFETNDSEQSEVR